MKSHFHTPPKVRHFEVILEKIKKVANKNLIPHGIMYETDSFYIFGMDSIRQEAIEEGYELILKDDPYTVYAVVNGYDPRKLLPENLPGDKYCVWGPRIGFFFFVRQTYKGKPGLHFHLHRGNGKPAFISTDEVSWWSNGEYHRDNNLPAYFTKKEVIWNVNGKWHRSDGGETVINWHYGVKYHVNHILMKIELNER